MFRIPFVFLVALIGCNPSAPKKELKTGEECALPAAVTIRPVKLAEFEKEIAANKGKIVVVDLWADFCLPCKEHFHHLVEMHEKHHKDGVACVSASVDDIDQKDRCLKFLTAKKANFANYLIDEKAGVWQDRWDVTAVPAVLVFGRDGKLARKFTWDNPDDQFTYPDVEKFVVGLIEKK